MGEYNIAPNTQIGKIVIDDKVYNNENYYHIEEEKYSRGGEFIENMVTDNMLEFCSRWFHLGNISEVLFDMDEYYQKKCGLGSYSNLVAAGFGSGNVEDFHYSPILPTSGKAECPIEFNAPKASSPVIFFNKRDPKNNYDTLYKNRKESANIWSS